MNLFIHGSGVLSAAGNNANENYLNAMPDYDTDRLSCKEPDYSAYIPAMQLRRMSKAVRMGIGASKICLEDAKLGNADAINVGTAFGCLKDSEVFLAKLIDQEEQMLTPTAFIQSTHNTVAGQIALVTACHGHNMTFVHRGHSFEHAMIDAQLYINQHPEHKVLVGGIEELTETSIAVLKQAGVYRSENSRPDSITNDYQQGSIAGEGAAFFMVSQQPSEAGLQVKDISTFATREASVALQKVTDMLHRNNLKPDDIDLVMLGINGDQRSENFYTAVRAQLFTGTSQACFKHLCGEYPVASSFALGLLAESVRNGLPDATLLNHKPKQLKHILLINNFLHHYSCWYLTAD